MKIEGGIMNFLSGTKGGIGAGFLMFFFMTYFLVINERNYKMTLDAIKEAGSVVVTADDVSRVDAELEGKLIYGVSKTQTGEIVTDELFDVAVNAIKIIRKVQYYQWVEIKHMEEWEDSDGETQRKITYSYEKQWTDEPVNSAKFIDSKYHSSNHVINEIKNMEKYADVVNWGAYELPEFLKNVADGVAPIEIKLSEATKEKWNRTLEQVAAKYTSQAISGVKSEYIHLIRINTVHLGVDPAVPLIGDIRVEISYIPPGRDMSIIAQTQGNTFTEYTARNGKTFFSARSGVVSLEKMLEEESDNSSNMAWAIRIMGILCIMFSLRLIFKPISSLLSKIPLLGSVVNGGIKFICTMLGLAWSCIVIAIAWLFYRPLIGLAILAVAIAIIWMLKRKGERIY